MNHKEKMSKWKGKPKARQREFMRKRKPCDYKRDKNGGWTECAIDLKIKQKQNIKEINVSMKDRHSEKIW